MRNFYIHQFPVERAVQLVTHNRQHDLRNVRFAFQNKGRFKRHLTFYDAEALQRALIEDIPDTVHVEFPENARPLVFDVDISDYANVPRNACNCEVRQVCNTCWVQIMRPEMIKARDFLCSFIGFTEVTFVFSGRKGFHVWVTDECVWTWDLNARRNYADSMIDAEVRCDKPVTAGKGHLIKLPWTRHQETGKVACVIENVETFLPWMG